MDRVESLRGDPCHLVSPQEAAAALFRGQRRVLCDRPDAALFADREEHRLQAVRQLAPAHHVRPSLLSPVLRASFFALGAAAGLAPRNLSAAVGAGVQDALVDVYNEQLRQLRVAGLADVEPEVRHTIMQLRDDERTIEGAPQAPDLLPYLAGSRRLSELTVEEGVAAVVKFGARLSLEITRRI